MALLPASIDATFQAITLSQGATWEYRFVWMIDGAPVDLTGMTVRAKVRPDFTTSPSLTFTCTLVDAVNGAFKVATTPAAIASIPVPGGLAANLREFDGGFWDVEIEDSAATIVRLIEGTVTVSREATT